MPTSKPFKTHTKGSKPLILRRYGQHLPLNRQIEIYAREGAAIEVSTLAEWVGACTASLEPIIHLIKLNGVDPQAYLADVLARLPDHPARRIDDLMPWNWARTELAQAA